MLWWRRPQALRIFCVFCAEPPFPPAVRCRDGEGRTQRALRATPHFLPLFAISTFPPFLPDSIGNFSLSLQSSQPLLTHRAFAGSLGASLPPAAPDPQSRATTATAATVVVPAARQTGINTHRHTQEQSQQLGRGLCTARSWTKARLC